MDKDFELIANFSTDIDARIAQGMLENNGIESYVESNSMATLYAAGATWAPIKLYVAREDAGRARELMEKHDDI